MARKGDLTINLHGTEYSSGDTVTGSVEFHAKRDLDHATFWVALVGEDNTGIDSEGDVTWAEIHREQMTVRGPEDIPEGHQEAVSFSFEVPPRETPTSAPADAGFLERRKAKRSRKAEARRKIRFRVEARVDVRGFDLTARAKLDIDGEPYRSAIRKGPGLG